MPVSDMFCGGIGDAIAMSGAAVEIERRGFDVRFAVPEIHVFTVSSFFVNHPGIRVTPPSEEQKNWRASLTGPPGQPHIKVEAIGFEPPASVRDMYMKSYNNLGISYNHRWESSPIEEAATVIPQEKVGVEDYIFLHDDSVRNFVINRDLLPRGNGFLPGFKRDRSILAFRDALENAREVHVMDSSFFHLAENLHPRGTLFLHRYARPFLPGMHAYVTRHYWNNYWASSVEEEQEASVT